MMAIHIHLYGGDPLRPRAKTIVIESAGEVRRREAAEDVARVKRITDGGGIAGIVLKSDRIGP